MELSRRHFTGLAAMSLTGVALSACGSDGQGTSPTTGGSSTAGGSSGAGGTISILTPEFPGTTGAEALEQGILDTYFEGSNYNYTVDYTAWNRLNEKLSTGVAGGIVSDIIMPGVGWVEPFADKGVLGEVPESILDGIPVHENLLQALRWDGKLYGLPYFVDGRIFIYNKQTFESAGITAPPASLEDMREALKALQTSSGPSIDLFSFGARQAWVQLVGAYDGKLFGDDGSVSFNDGSGLAALEYMRNLVDDGTASFEVVAADGQPRPWQTGEVAVDLLNSSIWPSIQEQTPELVTEDAMGMFVMPRAGGGDPVMFLGGTLLTVSRQTEHPETAHEVIRHFLSKESLIAAVEETGRVPARTDLESEVIDNNRMARFTIDNFEYATISEGGGPAWMDIRGQLDPEIEAVVTKQKTPQEAIDAMTKMAEDAVARS